MLFFFVKSAMSKECRNKMGFFSTKVHKISQETLFAFAKI